MVISTAYGCGEGESVEEKQKNYQQELLVWRWYQIRLRKKYMGTPPGFADKEEVQNAVQQWKADVKKFRKTREYRLISNYKNSEEIFTGREKLLSQISEVFQKKRGPVALYGIGGIGKSALAREYVRRYQRLYDHVFFLHYTSTIQNMLSDDFEVAVSNLEYSEERYSGRRKYFLVKYEILWKIAEKEMLLIVVDDCNTGKDRDLQRFFALPCDVILTTRRNPAVWNREYGIQCTGIAVTEFQTEQEWIDFVDGYRKKEYTAEELAELWEYRKKIHGHTLFMMLKVSNPNKQLGGSQNFQQDLFGKIHLKREEKNAMLYLSVMPVQGIPWKIFRCFTGISDAVLGQLMEYMLVQKRWNDNWGDEMLCLHPVIAEAARKVFVPSCSNAKRMIIGIKKYFTEGAGGNTWCRTYAENQPLEPYIFAVLRAFPKPVAWLAEEFDEMVTFLWIQGYFKEAEEYSMKIYQTVEKYYGEIHQLTGRMALRTAAVYYNSMQYSRAAAWYWKGYEILKNCRPADPLYLGYFSEACGKISRLYRHAGNLEEAIQYRETTVRCMEQLLEQLKNTGNPKFAGENMRYSYVLLDKAKILMQMGRTDEAGALYEKIMETAPEEIMDGFRQNEFKSFYIEILLEKGEVEKAYELAVDVAECAVKYRGEKFKDTLSCIEKLADICVRMGKTDEAVRKYETIVSHLQEQYPHQQKWLKTILDKLNTILNTI